jgi:hypothetical protein
MPSPGDAKEILTPELRKTAVLLSVIVGFIVMIIVSIQSAERFIDGRIDLRVAATRQQLDAQDRKINALETQISEMREMLVDIRADVRVLRTINEQRVTP